MTVLKPGKLANVDSDQRLVVPLAVLDSVEWWKRRPLDVTAEFVEVGYIRIFHSDDAAPLVDELAESFKHPSSDEQFERAVALADRYRPLKLYGNGRLRLTQEVACMMGFSLGERPTFYVQPFANGFEIMRIDIRNRRLEETKTATSISLHLSKPE